MGKGNIRVWQAISFFDSQAKEESDESLTVE